MQMWSKTAAILERQTKRGKKSEILLASLICYSAAKVAKDLFWPISFKSGVLMVKVSSQPQAANLCANQAQIIDKINQKIGREAVKTIRVKME